MIVLTSDIVVAIHDSILENEPGLDGFHGHDKLGGALSRIVSHIEYGGVDDLFDIAALYVDAIAMGHCFADANKRTSLACALTFLDLNDIELKSDERLAYLIEDFVKRNINRDDVANVFRTLEIEE